MKHANQQTRHVFSTLSILFLSLLSSCGKNAFNVTPSTQNIAGPGGYSIPPKVDFVMAVDDTGSMWQAYGSLSEQIQPFLNNLDQQRWDYHFATIPLTTTRPVHQVAGSIFDANRGASWVPAYPGDSRNDPGMIASSFFKLPEQYSDFIDPRDILGTVQQSGAKPGFHNILNNLRKSFNSSHFFRHDALTVVMVLGIGDDYSGINMCIRSSDQNLVPCESLIAPSCNPNAIPITTPPNPKSTDPNATCSSQKTSLNYYQAALQKQQAGLQFYSAVAASSSPPNTPNCQGGIATQGTRYQQMAARLNGQTFDICTVPIEQILSAVAQDLKAKKQNYFQTYLFLDGPPNPQTISIIKQSKPILPGSENGWTYDGYVKQVPTFYAVNPNGQTISYNLASGYAIHLHGSAALKGDDWVSVTYKPVGAQDSVSN